ncbi:hypothetical protein [uncultured Clostridium sp.]|uniref:hypothetical protein n=1 Tax=uncultured Clostridium sp. TaxID=59620 RepID=UPI0026735C61|nr:hypothetical protein [uncultured Clostridium sp.]
MDKRKKWTQEELDFLEEKWGVLSKKLIAKKLNRSLNSVIVKAVRLGLGGYINARDEITLNLLINTLGYKNSYSWVSKKFENHNIPIKKMKIIDKSVKMVNINEFWKWAEKNKEILNFADFEEGALGKEPLWVKEKRNIDKNSLNKINRNRLWTKYEEQLLISKVKSMRYTYEELSKEFNRTEGAIKSRLNKLQTPYRPLERDRHIIWTEEENNTLLQMYKEGYGANQIARKINKSEFSVKERVGILESRKNIVFKNQKWSKEEEKYLMKYFNSKTLTELSEELQRSKYAVSKKASRLRAAIINEVGGIKA